MPRSKQLKPAFAIAPRPVQARSMRTHGLFGVTYVRQHMMYDDKWSPSSLTDQFQCMADLLSKRLIFSKLETKATYRKNVQEAFMLRHKVRDGRAKLANVLHGQDSSQIRNFLMNHKDMQRLYQNMPVHLVDENIDQRTFVMRKERDRLATRLDQLKIKYQNTLEERWIVETRIRYEDKFVLATDTKSRYFRKMLQNSKVRLESIKTINGTYRKMIEILKQDAIFHDAIIQSLQEDAKDQATFIKHILYIGMPLDAKFRKLNNEYKRKEEEAFYSLNAKLASMGLHRHSDKRSAGSFGHLKGDILTRAAKYKPRYARRTSGMCIFEDQLNRIENTLKQVKHATLTSHALEIFPRFHNQIENNRKFAEKIANDMLTNSQIETKKERSGVLFQVLMNYLSGEQVIRENRIRELKDAIAEEEDIERDLLMYIKNRADALVNLRFSLWNLNEMLRYVDRSPRTKRSSYRTTYLKLPLLKFDMLTMRAAAPEESEKNVDVIMRDVKNKVSMLAEALGGDLKRSDLHENLERFDWEISQSFSAAMIGDAEATVAAVGVATKTEALVEKLYNVPSRNFIKSESAAIVEELSKKDD